MKFEVTEAMLVAGHAAGLSIADGLDGLEAVIFHPAPQQPAACRCVDCGGDQPRHDAGCLYMRELHGEQPADKPDRPGEAVAGLMEKWEQEAGRIGLSKWADGYITAMKRCLGELKAALSAKGENEDTTHER